jgi:hypothetical protein
MHFTPRERKLIEAQVSLASRAGRGWAAGVAVGALICAASVVAGAAGLWAEARCYLLLAFVTGMIVIEQSVNRRDRVRLARIIRKYASQPQRPDYPEDEEETM